MIYIYDKLDNLGPFTSYIFDTLLVTVLQKGFHDQRHR